MPPNSVLDFFENQSHQVSIQEYGPTIHNHLLELELSNESSLPSPVQEFSGLRMCCVNSLFDVVNRVGWRSSTFSLAVHLLDSYSSKTSIDRPHYRMVAFCCLWIASKYNENKPKGKLADALLKRAGYSPDEKPLFLSTESKILNTLGWNLSYPTMDSFLDLFLNTAEPNNVERRYGALFLCELSHFCPEIYLQFAGSSIATSAILVTNVAMLNLRHKHICQHRFGELDTLLLKSVISMPSAVRYKYLENQSTAPQLYSSTATVIRNLVDLAASFVKEQRQLDLHNHGLKLLQTSSSPSQDLRVYTTLPISPIASPTRHLGSPATTPTRSLASSSATSSSGRHGRSHSAASMLSRSLDASIPTPGSTPTATTFVYAKPSNSSTSLPDSSGANDKISQHFATPQIFTPVQLAPPGFLFSYRLPSYSGHLLCHYSQQQPMTASTSDEDMGKTLKKRRL
ncbi:DEKNAAC103652 [Brettanomyces naardenensis]|uniref:DEKNAAC103652 n=1 Tax=Brettanomyces naardenensis TaxID=13370 RepID=A0A448YP69_BRENA|nr:DEKNAAC103652 [Brettanomyces naardenensis]